MSIAPYGGKLTYRVLSAEAAKEVTGRAGSMPKVPLRDDAIVDLQNIAYGLFSPLEGFMGRKDYESVLQRKRLAGGLPWTIPILLDASDAVAGKLQEGKPALLVDGGERPVGVLHVEDKYGFDAKDLAQRVFRTTDAAHPGVARTQQMQPVLVGGKIDLLAPQPDPFQRWNLAPAETRVLFKRQGWKRIVAFQTRNPVHRAHEYLIKCALEICDAALLHPLVGLTKDDDIPADVRMRCYEVLLQHYFPRNRVALSVMPVNMRYAGPSEAIFHAVIRRNYGCTHFIVGRDHAGVGSYYGTYEAQEIFDEFDPLEIGIVPLRFEHSFFCKACGGMATAKTCPHGKDDHVFLSGTKVRQLLDEGQGLPGEFTRPEVANILLEAARNKSAPASPPSAADADGRFDPQNEDQIAQRLIARGYLPAAK